MARRLLSVGSYYRGMLQRTSLPALRPIIARPHVSARCSPVAPLPASARADARAGGPDGVCQRDVLRRQRALEAVQVRGVLLAVQSLWLIYSLLQIQPWSRVRAPTPNRSLPLTAARVVSINPCAAAIAPTSTAAGQARRLLLSSFSAFFFLPSPPRALLTSPRRQRPGQGRQSDG